MNREGTPLDEARRLEALASYQILDTPSEPVYDVFAKLAAQICSTPIALVSFVDGERQWFKACYGLDRGSTPREQAFCAHAILQEHLLEIPDTLADERFAENPLVTGEPHVRFYGGVPLRSPEGYAIGTLCVLDTQARKLTSGQRAALSDLATAVMATLEGRRRLLQLFDSTHNELYSVDLATRRFVFASRGALTSLGYRAAEFVRCSVYDVLPELTPERFEAVVRAMRESTRPHVVETVGRRRDGTTYPIELRAEYVRDGERELLFAVALDLSERKTAQEQIDLLRSAIEVAGDVVLIYAVDAHSGDLALSYMNGAYERQTGYRPQEALGRRLTDFRHGMPDDAGMRRIRAAIAAGEAVQAEIVSYRKDGSSFWNQVTLHPIRSTGGAVTHWISVERDVSEAVEREAQLEEHYARLLQLTAAAREIFGALDAHALAQRFTVALRRLTGADVTLYAMLTDGRWTPTGDLSVPEEPQRIADAFISNAASSQGHLADEGRRRAAARVAVPGRARYVVEIAARAGHVLRDADLFVLDLMVEYLTVAIRNAALFNELDERRQAIIELDQVKTDLIAMLAHDFKGRLTSIVGFADLALEMTPPQDERREYLETVKKSALQLADLASDTLAFSRLERNEIDLSPTEVDVVALVREVADSLADQRSVDVLAAAPVAVRADPARLRQVLYNLVENAIKYSPGGTPVQVRIADAGERVRIEVSDRGIGIPADELSSVFGRFSRASNARRHKISGSGFGLYLAKAIVERHGGSIGVCSTEGTGSTFTVELPKAAAAHEPAIPFEAVVVDPGGESRSFVAHALRSEGMRVRVVPTLAALFGALAARRADGVVVDSSAVELDAATAARLEGERRKHSFALVLLADGSARTLAHARYVEKPFLANDVIAALRGADQATMRSPAV